MFQTKPPKVKAKHIRECLKLVKRGDIILRGFDHYLDGKFIKGKYSHTGIVINKRTIAHAVAEGVIYIDILDYIKDCDRFIIVRFPQLNINKSIRFAKKAVKEKLEYDFLFSRESKKYLYCHEFGERFLNSGSIHVKTKESIIYGDDIINAGQIIYETHA
jgi:hypothetical protein